MNLNGIADEVVKEYENSNDVNFTESEKEIASYFFMLGLLSDQAEKLS
ncbi:hypothetical protein [Aquibacillus saliphilus]|nr:hypothetical protein [Aquibacillus saliphilus]